MTLVVRCLHGPSQILKFGTRPANIILGYYVNVEHPTDAADRQVRLQINLLFPLPPS